MAIKKKRKNREENYQCSCERGQRVRQLERGETREKKHIYFNNKFITLLIDIRAHVVAPVFGRQHVKPSNNFGELSY